MHPQHEISYAESVGREKQLSFQQQIERLRRQAQKARSSGWADAATELEKEIKRIKQNRKKDLGIKRRKRRPHKRHRVN